MPERAVRDKSGTDGDVQLVSNVIGRPWEDVKVGMAVKVECDDVTTEATLAKSKRV